MIISSYLISNTTRRVVSCTGLTWQCIQKINRENYSTKTRKQSTTVVLMSIILITGNSMRNKSISARFKIGNKLINK